MVVMVWLGIQLKKTPREMNATDGWMEAWIKINFVYVNYRYGKTWTHPSS